MALYYKSNNNWTEFAPNPYPIGTLVMNKDVDTSPANLVGGTWEKWDNTVESNYTLNYSQYCSITNFQVDSTGYCSGTFKVRDTFYIVTQEAAKGIYVQLGTGFFPATNANEDGYIKISETRLDTNQYDTHTDANYLYINNQGILTFKTYVSFANMMIRKATVHFQYYTSLVNPFGDFYNYKRIA